MYQKFSALLLTLAIMITLTACGSNNTAESTSDPIMSPIEATPAVVATPSDEPTASIAPTAVPQTSSTPAAEQPASSPVAEAPTATAKPIQTPEAKPTATPKAAETDGAVAEALFKQSCTSCHGVDLEGDFGPNLQKVGGHLSAAQITAQITDGGDAMPAFGKRLKSEQIAALAAWLSAKK